MPQDAIPLKHSPSRRHHLQIRQGCCTASLTVTASNKSQWVEKVCYREQQERGLIYPEAYLYQVPDMPFVAWHCSQSFRRLNISSGSEAWAHKHRQRRLKCQRFAQTMRFLSVCPFFLLGAALPDYIYGTDLLVVT